MNIALVVIDVEARVVAPTTDPAAETLFTEAFDREMSDQREPHDEPPPQPEPVSVLDTHVLRTLTVEKNDTAAAHIDVPAWMGPLFETLEAWRDTQTSATATISLDNPPMKLKVRLEGSSVDITFYTPDASVLAHGTAVAEGLHKLGLVLSSLSVREPAHVERHGNSESSGHRREHRRAARKERAR